MRIALSTLMASFLVISCLAYADSDDGFHWRAVRAACKDNQESDACREQREQARAYCAQHADKKQCRKIKALKECRHDPESELCKKHKEKFKAFCKEHPGAKKCVRARVHKICKDNPDSEQCLAVKEQAHAKFCKRHPDSERCN